MNDTRVVRAAVELRWKGEITIYRAAELKIELQRALHRNTRVDMDLSGVSELDSAGAQLLLWATRQADRAGGVLRLLDPSQATREVFDFLGLDRHLNIHPSMPLIPNGPGSGA